tara:strand:- start:265 stop:498 length:234 start_codon:yes stop_codon:yes gene_type:complete
MIWSKDLHEHRDLDIIRKNMPENGPQATAYKRILRDMDWDDMHDIYNIILGLTAAIKTMMEILVRNQVRINNGINEE